MEKNNNRVFVSYSHKDRSYANILVDLLKKDGFNTWYDVENLNLGQDLHRQITEGLKSSDYYVLLVSENSQESNWIKFERQIAENHLNKSKLNAIDLVRKELSSYIFDIDNRHDEKLMNVINKFIEKL
ncbi:toll/interleukin-1 receptor domain-containing protein [Paenibacillus radicis (ex Gao et al. 2016)]|uniref:TIR domain-containing protein n=1 Tax=Paenibacillus radicis (ex Gao et al. 2016) TaxID=1737354 RepID=A0A917M6H7_9BACL|nr:toll/interleukin-1 receptor domain-containing protein [Paenibacillus radicis (ex Gao et al. 2016)]GGG82036.1 hypothetical protein GCM10010918_44220 [Paenibacillus radicis (ex Gao et al. 2016)]